MSSPANPTKAWLLFATLILCGVAVTGFFCFLTSYDPAEAATATRQRWVSGTAFTLACVGLAWVGRAFRRLPRSSN
jgi:CDP-diglyceride synthetase